MSCDLPYKIRCFETPPLIDMYPMYIYDLLYLIWCCLLRVVAGDGDGDGGVFCSRARFEEGIGSAQYNSAAPPYAYVSCCAVSVRVDGDGFDL